MNKQGVGLGLHISKSIAKALGGDLKVQSKIGEGSKFTLSFPVNLEEKKILIARARNSVLSNYQTE